MSLGNILTAILVAALLVVLIFEFYLAVNHTIPKNFTFNLNNFGVHQVYVPKNKSIPYVLSLINADRSEFDLRNITYSNTSSAQQHADSMLEHGYVSHWDTFGLKPYMRYTLLDGKGSVNENAAYMYVPSGVDVLQSLSRMEYNMMYNDSMCCKNNHRNNILDPAHNQVSIGVAYNTTSIYLVEDFVNDYIAWENSTPNFSNGVVTLQGATQLNYTLSTIAITYDPPVSNLSIEQLKNTFSYNYGNQIAGVGHSVPGMVYYFPGTTTINASRYVLKSNNFSVSFSIGNLTKKYGAGEYTIIMLVSNTTNAMNITCVTDQFGIKHCNSFVASSYTIFINSSGQAYSPENV